MDPEGGAVSYGRGTPVGGGALRGNLRRGGWRSRFTRGVWFSSPPTLFSLLSSSLELSDTQVYEP